MARPSNPSLRDRVAEYAELRARRYRALFAHLVDQEDADLRDELASVEEAIERMNVPALVAEATAAYDATIEELESARADLLVLKGYHNVRVNDHGDGFSQARAAMHRTKQLASRPHHEPPQVDVDAAQSNKNLERHGAPVPDRHLDQWLKHGPNGVEGLHWRRIRPMGSAEQEAALRRELTTGDDLD